MKDNSEEKINAFVRASHRAAKYGLLRCSSGNLSARLDEQKVLLSASKSWLAELTAEQVAICELDSGNCVNGKTATIEIAFHLGILQNRPEVNVVLHFQSPFATAIACGNPRDYNFAVMIEIPYYIGEPAIVEYSPPGSTELAEAVVEAAGKHDMVIMQNHGLVTVGKDYNDAIQKASFFELACQILLLQKTPQFLPQPAIEALRKASTTV